MKRKVRNRGPRTTRYKKNGKGGEREPVKLGGGVPTGREKTRGGERLQGKGKGGRFGVGGEGKKKGQYRGDGPIPYFLDGGDHYKKKKRR